MPSPTFAESMVSKLQTVLLANAGASLVEVDGRKVQFADLKTEYLFWKRQVALEAGTAARYSVIDLSGQSTDEETT